jgi:iron complex transport system substrate-binding protein
MTGRAVLLMSCLMLLSTACSTASSGDTPSDPEPTIGVVVTASAASLPVVVSSADGREVTVTDTSRIVPLWGSITEIIFGLGLGDSVVGRDVSATFEEADGIPLVTQAHDVSAESVLALRPTLVLGSTTSGPASALSQIRNVGVPVITFEEPASVQDIAQRIRAIATALGVAQRGEELATRLEAELEGVQASIPKDADEPRVAFLYMRGQVGVYLIAGPGSGADSMIAAAGGIDAGTAMGLNQPFTPLTSEALVASAPDVILMTTTGLDSVGGIDGLMQIPGIAQTPAGQNRRVITVEDGLLYSFGPRTPAALELLIQKLYSLPAATAQ